MARYGVARWSVRHARPRRRGYGRRGGRASTYARGLDCVKALVHPAPPIPEMARPAHLRFDFQPPADKKSRRHVLRAGESRLEHQAARSTACQVPHRSFDHGMSEYRSRLFSLDPQIERVARRQNQGSHTTAARTSSSVMPVMTARPPRCCVFLGSMSSATILPRRMTTIRSTTWNT